MQKRDSSPSEKKPAGAQAPSLDGDRSRGPSTIVARELPSDTANPWSAPVRQEEQKTRISPARARRRIRRGFECTAAGCLTLGLGFLLLPREWVQPAEPPPAAAAPAEPPAEPEPAPAGPVAKDAGEWVARSIITGVRPARIVINGRVHKLNEPIAPFRVRWTGSAAGILIFQGPDGAEYRRALAQ